MVQRTPRSLHLALVLLLILVSTVLPASAQSTQLTQIAQTLDGQISMRLPANWMSRNAAQSNFTSLLAFGDTATSLQNMIDSLTNPATTTAPGINGIVGIFTPQLLVGLPADMSISTLLNSMINSAQQAGGTVLEQQSLMIGGLYPGSIALVSVPGEQAKGYLGVFQAGANIAEFTIGASPLATFDANQQTIIDMINSIRIPAENGSSLPPTAVLATPIPVNPNPQPPVGGGGVVASDTGIFSIRLPQDWTSQAEMVDSFADATVFGDSQASVQAVIDMIINGSDVNYNVTGIGGFVGALALGGQAPDALVTPLMTQILNSFTGNVTVVQPAQAHTFGGQYPGELAQLNRGYVAVMHSSDQLLLAILVSDNMDANQAQLTNLLETISIPAEQGQQQQNQPATPVPPQPTQSVARVPQTFRSSDNQVSLVLPGAGVVLDHIADQQVLAYGDSDAAAQSRLYSAKPDLAPLTPLSGSGGLLIIYPMDRFGIDPQNPDLAPLMERALGGLTGYTVEQASQPLDGGGVYAVIASSGERGYLALIPFGDQIAYVTSTTTPADFDANSAILLDIVKSVRIPAVSEESGLGGLGGLDSAAEATPEATEAPSGLSGL